MYYQRVRYLRLKHNNTRTAHENRSQSARPKALIRHLFVNGFSFRYFLISLSIHSPIFILIPVLSLNLSFLLSFSSCPSSSRRHVLEMWQLLLLLLSTTTTALLLAADEYTTSFLHAATKSPFQISHVSLEISLTQSYKAHAFEYFHNATGIGVTRNIMLFAREYDVQQCVLRLSLNTFRQEF